MTHFRSITVNTMHESNGSGGEDDDDDDDDKKRVVSVTQGYLLVLCRTIAAYCRNQNIEVFAGR
jgi:hypothetical protein